MWIHFKVTRDHIKNGSKIISRQPVCLAVQAALKTDEYLVGLDCLGLLEIYAIKQKGIPSVFIEKMADDVLFESEQFLKYERMGNVEFDLNIPQECLYVRPSANEELFIAPIYQDKGDMTCQSI